MTYLRKALERRDEGIALLSVILLMVVLTTFAIIVLGLVLAQVTPTLYTNKNSRTLVAAQAGIDAAVGVIDVKSYFIETPDAVAARIRECLKYAPPERLVFAPDCGLSQTARWAARQKLANMVAGARKVREERKL